MFMDEKTEKKLRILLANALVDTSETTYIYRGAVDMHDVGKDKKEKVEPDPEDFELINKQAVAGVQLYRQLPRKGQLGMIEILKEYLHDNSDVEIKKVVVCILCHTDNATIVINELKEGFKDYSQIKYAFVMLALAIVLKYKSSIFTEDEVESLHDWCVEYLNGKNEVGQQKHWHASLYEKHTMMVSRLREKTNILITESFTRQIEANFNPDINADEEKVKEFLEEIGYPKDLIESLNHINNQISDGDTPFKFKNTMDSIRAFTERLFECIAKSIDPESKIDGKDSAAAMKFFHEQGLISKDMADMIENFRHFISNHGVHRLKSKREDARIAKNIAVEISLYLMSRLREK